MSEIAKDVAFTCQEREYSASDVIVLEIGQLSMKHFTSDKESLEYCQDIWKAFHMGRRYAKKIQEERIGFNKE